MLAIDAHDACVVHHLDQNHHRVLRLHDLVVVVVDVRQHRRAAGGAEAEQATLAERTILGPVEIDRGAGRAECLEPGRRVGDFAVRRIDDERGTCLAIHDRELRARIEPERVVAAGVGACFRFDVGGGRLRVFARELREQVVRSNASASSLVSARLPLNMSSRSSEVSEPFVHVPCRSGAPHDVRGAFHSCAWASAAFACVTAVSRATVATVSLAYETASRRFMWHTRNKTAH